jgi:signal transduction histidine kinase
MTVQAGAARLLLDEDRPERAKESLLAVEETGRQALGEMRRLLGILRGDEHEERLAPQPGVADIDALVEQMRGAGLPVDVVVQGEPRELPPGVNLAAYRVVQEALTNTLKHAGAARAEVSIRYGKTALELAIYERRPRTAKRPRRARSRRHARARRALQRRIPRRSA